MADYRRWHAGRLEYVFLARLPTEAELAEGVATGAFVYDPWLRDHLRGLIDRALAPELLARCLDGSDEDPIDAAEHERAATIGRLFVELERERDEALKPPPIRDEWLDVAGRTGDALSRGVAATRRRLVGRARRRIRRIIRRR
jgi:hypothetical protein